MTTTTGFDSLEDAIRAAAPKKRRKIVLTDLDGTVYGPDTTVVLNEEFGSRHPDGVPLYKRWREQHAAGLMSIAEHLGNEFADIFRAASLEEVLEFLQQAVQPMPGIHQFLEWLKKKKIRPIGVSNGAEPIARNLLAHHGIPIKRLIANTIEFGVADGISFRTLSGEVGLNKGEVVEWFRDHGYKIYAAIGDSTGDIGLAIAAGKNKIPVFTAGADCGLANWCAKNSHLLGAGWRPFNDFREIPAFISRK